MPNKQNWAGKALDRIAVTSGSIIGLALATLIIVGSLWVAFKIAIAIKNLYLQEPGVILTVAFGMMILLVAKIVSSKKSK